MPYLFEAKSANKEQWNQLFDAITPIVSKYNVTIHRGWKYLINREIGLALKIQISANTKGQLMIWIEPANGWQSKAESQRWISRLDCFYPSLPSFERWIKESIFGRAIKN